MERRLPDVGIGRMLGLMEVISSRGGEENTVTLSADLDLQLDELLPVIEGCEMLGFAEVKSGKVVLTKDGKEILDSHIDKRKNRFRQQMLKIQFFQELADFIKSRKSGKVGKRTLNRWLGAQPRAAREKTIQRILDWGRYAELIDYKSDADELRLL